jgi:hypothetical protein
VRVSIKSTADTRLIFGIAVDRGIARSPPDDEPRPPRDFKVKRSSNKAL